MKYQKIVLSGIAFVILYITTKNPMYASIAAILTYIIANKKQVQNINSLFPRTPVTETKVLPSGSQSHYKKRGMTSGHQDIIFT